MTGKKMGCYLTRTLGNLINKMWYTPALLDLAKFKLNCSVQFKKDVVHWQKTHKSPRTVKRLENVTCKWKELGLCWLFFRERLQADMIWFFTYLKLRVKRKGIKYPHNLVQVEQEVIGLNCNKKDLG